MFAKVRPAIDRGTRSAPEPIAGLSEGRLALVHRYMIDAEEAEALAQTAAERAQKRPPAEVVGEERAGPAIAERRAKVPAAEATTARRGADGPATEEIPRPVPAKARANGGSRVVEQTVPTRDQLDPREEARARKRLVNADKRAAKQAVRELAALEKKELRERKALAKAAARRH